MWYLPYQLAKLNIARGSEQYRASFYLEYCATWPDYSCVVTDAHNEKITAYGKPFDRSLNVDRRVLMSLGQFWESTNHLNHILNITDMLLPYRSRLRTDPLVSPGS
jgi:hypothetical protein